MSEAPQHILDYSRQKKPKLFELAALFQMRLQMNIVQRDQIALMFLAQNISPTLCDGYMECWKNIDFLEDQLMKIEEELQLRESANRMI